MGKAWVIGFGGLLVLGGCGTLLDIQPDSALPNDDGGMPGADGSSAEGAAPGDAGDSGDAADGGPNTSACALSAPSDSCVLAEGLVNLGSIAVANGNVYFARHENPGAILQVPTGGGAVTPFAAGSMLPAGLSATATALYWVTEGDFQIVRKAFDGSPLVSSTYGVALPAAQIVDVGTDTFWTIPGTGANGEVRVTSSFNAGVAIATTQVLPTAIAADGSWVYFAEKTSAGHIVRMAHDATAMSTAGVTNSGVNALALSSAGNGIVAMTSAGGVYRTSTQLESDFTSPWTQVSTNSMGVGLVADATTGTLYVLVADGTLETIPNVPTPQVKTINMASCTAGTAIAQDASHVYLACKDTIVRVPK